jgi:hypothetical protein
MPDGVAWPKIIIVAPSFNQGEFTEDGGSTGPSVEIIEPDQGMDTL